MRCFAEDPPCPADRWPPSWAHWPPQDASSCALVLAAPLNRTMAPPKSPYVVEGVRSGAADRAPGSEGNPCRASPPTRRVGSPPRARSEPWAFRRQPSIARIEPSSLEIQPFRPKRLDAAYVPTTRQSSTGLENDEHRTQPFNRSSPAPSASPDRRIGR